MATAKKGMIERAKDAITGMFTDEPESKSEVEEARERGQEGRGHATRQEGGEESQVDRHPDRQQGGEKRQVDGQVGGPEVHRPDDEDAGSEEVGRGARPGVSARRARRRER
ncbi:MAG: hypothetical protein ACXWVT_14330 [Burkholderiaceae bacterium]